MRLSSVLSDKLQLFIRNLTSDKTELNNINCDELTIDNSDDINYTYVTPSSKHMSFDFIAECVQSLNLNVFRTALICENAIEAEEMLQEMGSRGVGCILLNHISNEVPLILRFWTDGLVTGLLVLSDDLLRFIDPNAIKVNFLINSTLPLPHIFQKRIVSLTRSTAIGKNVLTLRVPRSAGAAPAEARSVVTSPNAPPEAPAIEQSEVSPKAFSEALPEAPATAHRDETTLSRSSSVSDDSAMNSKIEHARHFWRQSTFEMNTTYNHYGVFVWSPTSLRKCLSASDLESLSRDLLSSMKGMLNGNVLPKSLQRYAWHQMEGGLSMSIVGNEGTGKTWCYLPFLVNLAKQLELSSIIIVANETQGKHIESLCQQLLGSSKYILAIYDHKQHMQMINKVDKHRGIVITTVVFLRDLLSGGEVPFLYMDEIRCVAIDNLDEIFKRNRMSCQFLINEILSMLKHRFRTNHCQLVIVGRLWNEAFMSTILREIPNMMLLFEDALEASIKGQIQHRLLITDNADCDEKVIDEITSWNLQVSRVVLVVRHMRSVSSLKKCLMNNNIQFHMIDNRGQQEAFDSWHDNRESSILIVSDEAISSLRDKPIHCLIHYSNSSCWQRFKSRYSLFYGNYKDWNETKGTAITVIRRCDAENMYPLAKFFNVHDRIFPESYLNVFNSQRILLERQNFRTIMPLCHQFLSYGNCFRRSCQFRHVIDKSEILRNPYLPNKGNIEFYILRILSPNHLSVRLSHLEPAMYYYTNPLTNLGKSIHFYYNDSKNRKLLSNPQPGQICITKIGSLYQRVRVNTTGGEVKQLDAGSETMMIKKKHLFECDAQFLDEPFEAIEMYITGLSVFNVDRCWPNEVMQLLVSQFPRQNSIADTHSAPDIFRKCDIVYSSSIDFAFYDSIFVDTVHSNTREDIKSFLIPFVPYLYVDAGVKQRFQGIIENACKESST